MMENNKLGQKPAFACITSGSESYLQEGMSKRFYAACAAMQGLLSGNLVSISTPDDAIVEMSYKLADELLKQENL